MTPEQVFSVANTLALLSWVALVTLPRVPWVAATVTGVLVPALLAVAYVALIIINWGGPGGFSTLAGVAQLFSNPWLLLAGWIHYLAFDLLIGSWEARDARERHVPHWLLVPCLILTFLFGPAGWLLYRLCRGLVSCAVRRSPNLPPRLPAQPPTRLAPYQPPTWPTRLTRPPCPTDQPPRTP